MSFVLGVEFNSAGSYPHKLLFLSVGLPLLWKVDVVERLNTLLEVFASINLRRLLVWVYSGLVLNGRQLVLSRNSDRVGFNERNHIAEVY